MVVKKRAKKKGATATLKKADFKTAVIHGVPVLVKKKDVAKAQ